MDVSEAVDRRTSVRAFLPDPVPASVVRTILERAHRSPSGGNLQPWRVHAIAGAEMGRFRALMAERIAASPRGEPAEYAVYPEALHEPFRSRRHAVGEAMYAKLGVERDNRLGRLMWFARNYDFFGAPVGLFFTLDRKLGAPQWVDVGMYMQTVMLLAVEAGLDTCAQEAWSAWPKTVAEFLGLDGDQILFAGMALGRADPDHALAGFRSAREPFEAFAEMRGFEGAPDGG